MNVMFTLVFEILLFETRLVLPPAQWGTGSERVKKLSIICSIKPFTETSKFDTFAVALRIRKSNKKYCTKIQMFLSFFKIDLYPSSNFQFLTIIPHSEISSNKKTCVMNIWLIQSNLYWTIFYERRGMNGKSILRAQSNIYDGAFFMGKLTAKSR